MKYKLLEISNIDIIFLNNKKISVILGSTLPEYYPSYFKRSTFFSFIFLMFFQFNERIRQPLTKR